MNTEENKLLHHPVVWIKLNPNLHQRDNKSQVTQACHSCLRLLSYDWAVEQRVGQHEEMSSTGEAVVPSAGGRLLISFNFAVLDLAPELNTCCALLCVFSPRVRMTAQRTTSTRTPSLSPWRWPPSTTPSWLCPEPEGSPTTSRRSPWRTNELHRTQGRRKQPREMTRVPRRS